MTDFQNLQCIAFDADDTLWENGFFYGRALAEFLDLFDPASLDLVEGSFNEVEERNLSSLGYGAKAMTISMIETAITVNPQIDPAKLLKIIEIGKSLFEVPVKMLPGVLETLEYLKKKYRLIIITKGELNEQQRKFDLSPIDKSIDYFIVDDKTPESYSRLLAHEHIDIDRFMMVGNSPKSDIIPILQLGGCAAYIPNHATWSLEHAVLPEKGRLLELTNIRELIDHL